MIRIQDKIKYIKAVLLAAALLVGVMSFGNGSSPVATFAAATCPIALKADGSTTVFPISQAMQAPFEASRPGTTVTFGPIGSGNGINEVIAGTNDIAPSSRPLKAGAEQTDLWPFLIGHDAFVIAVQDSPAMSFLTNITDAQIKNIYEGTDLFWDQDGLGGPHQAIIPRARITGSGSYSEFLSHFAIASASEATTITNTGLPRLTESLDMANAAAANAYQIAYTGLPFLPTPNLKALTLDNVAPSADNVRNLVYPNSGRRDLFLMDPKISFVGSRIDNSNAVLADDLVNFFLSSTGQTIVNSVGDVAIVVPTQPPIPDWDVNMNGGTSLSDLGAVTAKWGQSSGCKGWIRADVNNNGSVSLSDIGGVTSHWGQPGFVPPS